MAEAATPAPPGAPGSRRRSRPAPVDRARANARSASSTQSTIHRACRSPTRSASSEPASCSAPKARNVSSNTYRRPGARCTSERSTNSDSNVATSAASKPQTAAASAAANGRENTDSADEHTPQFGVERVERPRHRRRQRRVAGRVPVAHGQQLEPLIHPCRHLAQLQAVQTRRRQLDRQRQAVEATHDLDDLRTLRGVGLEHRRHRRRPLPEELDRRRLLVAGGQRRHGAQLLACHTQPLTARRHDRHVGAAGDDPVHEIGRRVEDVLAVVQAGRSTRRRRAPPRSVRPAACQDGRRSPTPPSGRREPPRRRPGRARTTPPCRSGRRAWIR